MNRLLTHLMGICLIPFLWAVVVLVIASILISGIVLTVALAVVPNVVKINGLTLKRILRKARK